VSGLSIWSRRLASPRAWADQIRERLTLAVVLWKGDVTKTRGLGTWKNGEGEMAESNDDGSSGEWSREEIAGPAIWRAVYEGSVYFANTRC